MVDVDGLKGLRCVFYDNVLCSYRKSLRCGVMDRCLKCDYYVTFMHEMAEEDDKVMDELDEMHRLHECYLCGEISEEELRKRFFAYDEGESE